MTEKNGPWIITEADLGALVWKTTRGYTKETVCICDRVRSHPLSAEIRKAREDVMDGLNDKLIDHQQHLDTDDSYGNAIYREYEDIILPMIKSLREGAP